jgi:hypothetical protein
MSQYIIGICHKHSKNQREDGSIQILCMNTYHYCSFGVIIVLCMQFVAQVKNVRTWSFGILDLDNCDVVTHTNVQKGSLFVWCDADHSMESLQNFVSNYLEIEWNIGSHFMKSRFLQHEVIDMGHLHLVDVLHPLEIVPKATLSPSLTS